jgi:hypothetical protein
MLERLVIPKRYALTENPARNANAVISQENRPNEIETYANQCSGVCSHKRKAA